MAALAGERIQPARWPDRRRCLDGGLLAADCAATLAVPAPDMVIATWLGLPGGGLGTYIPANNTAIWAIHLSGPEKNRPLDAVVMAAWRTKIWRLVRLTEYPLRQL